MNLYDGNCVYAIGVGLPVINPIINNIPRMPNDNILTILATFGVGFLYYFRLSPTLFFYYLLKQSLYSYSRGTNNRMINGGHILGIPMKIRRVYFQIKVSDLGRAKDFYNDVFGFEVAWFMDTDAGWCEMQLPNDARLGLNTREPGQDIFPSWGILTLDVENLEETRDYLDKKGLKPNEIADIPDMVSLFDVFDSEGNKIQIVSDPRVKSEEK